MTFEYAVQKTFNETIDLVDIGNVSLKCTSTLGIEYYIRIKTVLGKVHLIKFGPVCSDLESLFNDFNVAYKKFDFKESVICKEIDKFINDYKKGITSVEEITEYELWENFPEIKNSFEAN